MFFTALLFMLVGTGQAGVKVFTSILGDDPRPSLLDQDIYMFNGVAGEEVVITLEKHEDTSPANFNTGHQGTLVLTDHIHGTFVLKIDRSALPNTITVTLPANGTYYIMVLEQLKFFSSNRFRGVYRLTLESQDACPSLEPTPWVETVVGDLDGNGDVDFDDLDTVVGCLDQDPISNPACEIADLFPPSQGDGIIDIFDLQFVGSHICIP
jgi:hypothetical protein